MLDEKDRKMMKEKDDIFGLFVMDMGMMATTIIGFVAGTIFVQNKMLLIAFFTVAFLLFCMVKTAMRLEKFKKKYGEIDG